MASYRIFLFYGFILVVLGCSRQVGPLEEGPPEVDVAKPLTREIVEWDEYTGRFEAVHRVDVRSRVTGYLTEKKFKDGQRVMVGDVLYIIDPRPFAFRFQEMEARFLSAEKEYERAVLLRQEQAISQEDLDRRLENLNVARANLDEAKLDLEFTEVRSPIHGRVSEGFVDVGNLVRENDTTLTRVVSIHPIHFEFEASQSELLKYLRLDREGRRPGSTDTKNPVWIKLLDEDAFLHKGHMDFVDNVVDPSTGTIKARAIVPNQDGVIYPGLFGRARVSGSGLERAVLIPERAVNTDQGKKFVYVVGSENEVQRAYVEVSPPLDNGLVIVRSGLLEDARVVISGIQRIRFPKQIVDPREVEVLWVDAGKMVEP